MSSSDGQFFQAGGYGLAASAINARYGSEPGVSFYSHLSDRRCHVNRADSGTVAVNVTSSLFPAPPFWLMSAKTCTYKSPNGKTCVPMKAID